MRYLLVCVAILTIDSAVAAQRNTDTRPHSVIVRPSADPNPADYDRVLIPIAFVGERDGALGSRWQSSVWYRNEATVPVIVSQFEPRCRIGCDGQLPFEVPPHTTVQLEPVAALQPVSNHGVLLHVTKGHARTIFFTARVRDLSAGGENLGTEVPVIRRSEAFTTKAVFPDVPIEPGYRLLLRVYNFTGRSGETVRLRFFPRTGSDSLVDTTLTLSVVEEDPRFPPHPAYAELPFYPDAHPQIAASPLRIEVQPLEPGTEFWTMISLTNNETHQITLITPQP